MPAGGRGKITVSVDTAHDGGRSIKKRVFVYTNDPGRKRALLIVRGNVLQFVQISPTKVTFKGYAADPLTVRVFIRQMPDHPFAITGIRTKFGRDIRYHLEEIPGRDPKEYLLLVENVRAAPGIYNDLLLLDTDHPKRPVLEIPVVGRLSIKPVFDGTQGKPAQ